MFFGLVTGLLVAAILINMGNVECGIRREKAGTSLVSRLEEINSVEERWLEDSTWEEIFNVFKGIYPGTKWCGISNVAKNEDDFGRSKNTDMCCKQHDNCEIYIEAFRSNYGLRNIAPYTVSSCDCDEKFLQCMVGVVNSTTVPTDDKKTAYDFGRLFFNLVSPKCLKQDYPLVCLKPVYEIDDAGGTVFKNLDAKIETGKKNRLTNVLFTSKMILHLSMQQKRLWGIGCKEYKQDTNKDKVWQLIKGPTFPSK